MGNAKKLQYEQCEDDDDDRIYGYCNPKKSKEVHINVGYIWNKYKDIDKFIYHFCRTHEHEMIHQVIEELVPKKRRRTNYREEKIIRYMMKERFTKSVRMMYIWDDRKER